MAYDVFISYSSKDFITANAACAAIEITGAHCWMAPRNIRPGKAYGEAIIEGMNECKIFVLIYSPHSNVSPQVLREVERAVSKGLEVITLRLAEFPMTKAMEYFLASSHWLNAVSVDMGDYLKTLSESVHLGLNQPDAMCQFDVTNTSYSTQVPSLTLSKHNIPSSISSFIGRVNDLNEVSELIVKYRLVTLSGFGGTGKTRLALEIASSQLEHYKDGVWWIDISVLSNHNSILQSMLKTLNLTERSTEPIQTTLVNYIKDKRLLFIIDNCEHLLDACRTIINEILTTGAYIKVIVTSREPLGITGEYVWHVKPFTPPSIPDLPHSGKKLIDTLTDFDVIHLFLERASESFPGFTLTEANAMPIAKICYRLDGLPLAIELAAARVKAISLEQILLRLDDQFRILGGNKGAPARQQTLRATLDWSYELLDKNEQVLLNRLSIFQGAFTLDAIESICAMDPINDWDVLDLLTQLIDKSLVISEEWEGAYRYRQLQSIREYATEKWGSQTEDFNTISLKHAQFYHQLLADIEPKLWGEYQGVWLEKLDHNKANWLKALSWIIDQNLVDKALGFASSASRFWLLRGDITEGRLWLEKVQCLAHNSLLNSSSNYAKVLNACGSMAWSQNDLKVAKARFEESLTIYKSLNDTQHTADLLNNLGNLALDTGNDSEAKDFLEIALGSFKSIVDKQGMSAVLGNLGLIALRNNQLSQAKIYYQESLVIDRELGDSWAIATSLHGLGLIACREREAIYSYDYLEESLKLRNGISDNAGIAEAIEGFAELALTNDQYERAACLLAAASVIREQCGAMLPKFEEERIEAFFSAIQAKTDKSIFDECIDMGRSWPLRKAVMYAYGIN